MKGANPWMVLLVTSLGVVLVMMNMSTLTVALPSITSFYDASAMEASWVLLAYMLCNTVFILIFGKVADVFGRKRLFTIGIVTFTCFSFLCGIAATVEQLIVYRALQGISGALVITNTTPLITDAFRGGKMSKALGINVVVSSVAQLIGPVVGGYFTHYFNWQWVFWCNVPLGIVAAMSAMYLLPTIQRKRTTVTFDYIGSATIFIALSSFIYGLTMGGEYGWHESSVHISFVVAVIFIIATIVVERAAKAPIIQFALFKERIFCMANVATFFNALARSSVVLLMALYFQVSYGANALQAGIWVLPLTAGTVISSFFIGHLAEHFQTKVLTVSGLLISSIGILFIMLNVHVHGLFYALMIGQFFIGFGSGVFMTPNTQLIMLTVPATATGIANGIRSMLQNMGGVLSTAFALVIVTLGLPSELKARIYTVGTEPLTLEQLSIIASGFKLAFIVILIITLCAVVSAYFTTAPRVQLEKNLVEE